MMYEPLSEMSFDKETIDTCLNCTAPECKGVCKEFQLQTSSSGISHREKRIKCIETGEHYKSIAAAAKALHIGSAGNISFVLAHPQRSIHGYHFIFD